MTKRVARRAALATSLVLAGGAALAAGDNAGHEAPAGRAALKIDVSSMRRDGDRWQAPVEGGGSATLTLIAALQDEAESIFKSYEVPYAAAVMMTVPDGQIVTLAAHSAVNGKLGPADLALKAWAPAASIFKLVSAAALVTSGGQTADSKVCYHGGLHGIDDSQLSDNAKLDTACDTLAFAVGKSQNSIIAKMATRFLTPDSLRTTAASFGFGTRIPFVAELEPSTMAIPSEKLEFARAAAGFFHTSLSPLHGALLAATVASEGLMPRPLLVAEAKDGRGAKLTVPSRRARRVLEPEAALAVANMMEVTTRIGTAKSSFHDGRGRPLLPYKVAGKTGSLNHRGRLGDPVLPSPGTIDNYLQYTWFVGFAPLEKPEVAFSVILGNSAKWRIKPAYVAQRLLTAWDNLKKKSGSAPRVIAQRRSETATP